MEDTTSDKILAEWLAMLSDSQKNVDKQMAKALAPHLKHHESPASSRDEERITAVAEALLKSDVKGDLPVLNNSDYRRMAITAINAVREFAQKNK